MRRTIFEDVHEDFRESVRAFLLRDGLPHTEEWERNGLIDPGFLRRAAEQGMVGFAAPVEFGGLGIDDFRFNVVISEEFADTGTVGDAVALTNDITMPYLLELTTDEQKQRWLPTIASGEVQTAIAMTEPGAGSDLRGIECSASWNGDHYLLTGSKTFVTSGIQAGLLIVAAQTRKEGLEGIGLFVVTSDMEGFKRGRKLDKVGRRAQDTAELFFDEVAVPPENVLGEPDKGLRYLMGNLAQERLGIAVTAVAASRHALELTIEYARERHAFGQSIGKFQANRFLLADLHTEVEIAQAFIDRCIEAHLSRELTAVEAAGAKMWTTELQCRVIDACVQLHGAYGYMNEYEIARMWRDARVTRIYGGTNEIMKEIVGRSLAL
jgi:acyl-CoA dehydrogenase